MNDNLTTNASNEAESPALGEVQLRGSGHEVRGQVLLCCDLSPGPHAPCFGRRSEALLHGSGHVAVGQPRRIAHQGAHPVVLTVEPQGTREVAHVVAPDMVPAIVVEAAQCREGVGQRGAVGLGHRELGKHPSKVRRFGAGGAVGCHVR